MRYSFTPARSLIRPGRQGRPGPGGLAPPPGAPLVDFDPDVLTLGAITSAGNQGSGGATYDLTSGGATVVADGPNGHQAFEFGGGQRLQAAQASSWRWLHYGGVPVHVLALVRAPSANPDALIPICGTSAGASNQKGVSFWIDDRSANARNEQLRHMVSAGTTALGTQTGDGAVTPLDSWRLVEWTMTVGSMMMVTLFVDGVQVAFNYTTATPSADNPTNPLQLGDLGASNYPAPAGTRIGRVLMYDSGANVADARAWMLAYAGLA